MDNYFYHNFLMEKNVIFFGLTIIINIYKILLKKGGIRRVRMRIRIKVMKIIINKYIIIMY
jgi:hypothetical protein